MKKINWRLIVIVIVISALTSLVSGFASSTLRSGPKATNVPYTFTTGTTASAKVIVAKSEVRTSSETRNRRKMRALVARKRMSPAIDTSASQVNDNFQALATAIDGVASHGVKAWAWVEADGTIANQGGTSTVTVHKVGTGEYCIQTDPDVFQSYYPLIATLQGGDLTPGLINANTGWGSDCNPYGANGVFTATISGAAADYAFSVIIP